MRASPQKDIKMPAPAVPLPFDSSFQDVDAYIESLLSYSQDALIKALCGGVHVLDFFIKDPPTDLYSRVVPEEWRGYFTGLEVQEILDLFLRKDVESILQYSSCPESLRNFITETRRHSIVRDFHEQNVPVKAEHLKNYLSGMKPKKIHEVNTTTLLQRLHTEDSKVVNFSSYVSELASFIKSDFGVPLTHLVDFGSGLGYLPRVLASEYYGHNVVGLESGADRIDAAKVIDARLKKQRERAIENGKPLLKAKGVELKSPGKIQHVLKRITDGNLNDAVEAIKKEDPELAEKEPKLMIISLHSCGNLIHHALNSLILTPSVSAVAIIGCCYNLMTEKRGATFKPPYRDTLHDRVTNCATACDPHGFPLSSRLEKDDITLNITARMMACQAPYNWTEGTSEDFFTRHYYRALLQRLLMDKGFIPKPEAGEVGTQPLVIGSLRKASYVSFESYVEAAAVKVAERLGRPVEIDVQEVRKYDNDFRHRRKDVCILWSLMAFAAGVVESVILVDRYLFLKEKLGAEGSVWVETVFEYQHSPRNCVIVAVKNQDKAES